MRGEALVDDVLNVGGRARDVLEKTG